MFGIWNFVCLQILTILINSFSLYLSADLIPTPAFVIISLAFSLESFWNELHNTPNKVVYWFMKFIIAFFKIFKSLPPGCGNTSSAGCGIISVLLLNTTFPSSVSNTKIAYGFTILV